MNTLSTIEAQSRVNSNNKPLYIVFCGMSWCSHCIAMKPIFDNIALQFTCCQTEFIHIDCEEDKTTLANWVKPELRGFPTFLAFANKAIKSRKEGAMTNDQFRNWLLSEGMDCASSFCASKTS